MNHFLAAENTLHAGLGDHQLLEHSLALSAAMGVRKCTSFTERITQSTSVLTCAMYFPMTSLEMAGIVLVHLIEVDNVKLPILLDVVCKIPFRGQAVFI